MYSKASAAAIAGLVAASVVSAAPANWYSAASVSTTYTSQSAFPTVASSNNSDFPLSNGFPTPAQDAIDAIQTAAGGSLPAGAPPSLQPDSLVNLRLIAFNELSEVAFFTELLQNVTSNKPGFEVPASFDRDYIIDSLIAIQAQEELHLLNANNALSKFDGNGIGPIQPCDYDFPVNSLLDAIKTANEFTDVVLGTLQDVIVHFANNNDTAPIRGTASSVGQEGEQDGFFRLLLGKRASAQPFLTQSARDIAFSALNQNFVKNCPQDVTKFGLKIFSPLKLDTTPKSGDGTLTFEITQSKNSSDSYSYGNSSANELQLVYLSGQDAPITEDITDLQTYGDTVKFVADFPQKSQILDGLTIAVVTTKGNFTTLDEVVENIQFGPALIEVD